MSSGWGRNNIRTDDGNFSRLLDILTYILLYLTIFDFTTFSIFTFSFEFSEVFFYSGRVTRIYQLNGIMYSKIMGNYEIHELLSIRLLTTFIVHRRVKIIFLNELRIRKKHFNCLRPSSSLFFFILIILKNSQQMNSSYNFTANTNDS